MAAYGALLQTVVFNGWVVYFNGRVIYFQFSCTTGVLCGNEVKSENMHISSATVVYSLRVWYDHSMTHQKKKYAHWLV